MKLSDILFTSPSTTLNQMLQRFNLSLIAQPEYAFGPSNFIKLQTQVNDKTPVATYIASGLQSYLSVSDMFHIVTSKILVNIPKDTHDGPLILIISGLTAIPIAPSDIERFLYYRNIYRQLCRINLVPDAITRTIRAEGARLLAGEADVSYTIPGMETLTNIIEILRVVEWLDRGNVVFNDEGVPTHFSIPTIFWSTDGQRDIYIDDFGPTPDSRPAVMLDGDLSFSFTRPEGDYVVDNFVENDIAE